jgi:hypothetical protein
MLIEFDISRPKDCSVLNIELQRVKKAEYFEICYTSKYSERQSKLIVIMILGSAK